MIDTPTMHEINRVARYWRWVEDMACEHEEIVFTNLEPMSCMSCGRPVRMLSDVQIENMASGEGASSRVTPTTDSPNANRPLASYSPARRPAMTDRMDEIRERMEAATEGPWFRGERWHVQGASHCKCRPDYGPLIHEGPMDINGDMMPAHVHERPDVWHKPGITVRPSERTGWHVGHVVVDTDEYGLMDDDDAEFIAHAREDVPWLLAEVERLTAEAATLRETVQRVRSALEGHPECDRYPNVEGGISCGWKRAVADVTAALGDAPEGDDQ